MPKGLISMQGIIKNWLVFQNYLGSDSFKLVEFLISNKYLVYNLIFKTMKKTLGFYQSFFLNFPINY